MNTQKIKIQFTLNNQETIITTYPMKRLIDVLRDDLHLTGTKEGCGEGECGACAVFINGELVNSCLVPIIQVDGTIVSTIENFASDFELDRIQESFINNNGAQCGICTPGMILASSALLMKNANPNEQEIREGISGNLCRCTGYTKIFEAIESLRS